MTSEKMNAAECKNSKKCWYWYLQHFSKAVLVLVSAILVAKILLLVLTIVLTSIVNTVVSTQEKYITAT